MLISYRKLVDIQIQHDYYLPPGDPNAPFPAINNILEDLEIVPSAACRQSLKDNQMVIRTNSTGFQLLIRAERAGTDWKTFIPVDAGTKWTFYLRLRNPYWHNFTNLRLQSRLSAEVRKTLYFFSNLSGSAANSKLFLSTALPTFPNLYSDNTKYQLGDLILGGIGNTHVLEAIENEIDPAVAFDASEWRDTDVQEIHYVNPGDLIAAQGMQFTYARNNTNPGETIQFALKNAHQQAVSLGIHPDTGENQHSYSAPIDPAQQVRHTISFVHLPEGRYTLSITDTGANEPDRVFYLADPSRLQNVYGVLEVFAKAKSGFEILDLSTPGQSIITEKTYYLRFKNRMTKWIYLKKDGTQLVESPYRAMSKLYSRFQHLGKSLPDPNPATIIPDLTGDKITDIKSIIYLNE